MFFSVACVPMAVVFGLVVLVVSLAVCAVMYKRRSDKKKNALLRNESQRSVEKQYEVAQEATQLRRQFEEVKKKEEDDKKKLQSVVNILKGQKKKSEEQKDKLKEQLEENKKNLQSVETEIKEKEKTHDKPESLLKQKEDLLQAQWKLDEKKKNCEQHILNIDQLLELLEILVT